VPETDLTLNVSEVRGMLLARPPEAVGATRDGSGTVCVPLAGARLLWEPREWRQLGTPDSAPGRGGTAAS